MVVLEETYENNSILPLQIYEKNLIAKVVKIAGSTLAASNIRNLDCSSYEVYLIDYGCGKFNKKVHIME